MRVYYLYSCTVLLVVMIIIISIIVIMLLCFPYRLIRGVVVVTDFRITHRCDDSVAGIRLVFLFCRFGYTIM